jgi:hypothetical protein
LYSWFGKTEVVDFALLNQLLHRCGHIFYRHIWVNAVLVEQVDHICPQSFERTLGDLFDVRWPTIEADLLTFGTNLETEFGSYHHLAAKRSERFAHEFFIRKRTIHFSGIEESDTQFDGLPEQRDHLILVFRRTVAKAHSHTAQPDGRDFQVFPEFPLFHFLNSERESALNSHHQLFAHSDFSEAMSMEKRYFTSDLSNLSYASLTF